MGNFKEDLAGVRAFVFDVDGVFTDGNITVTPDNDFIRTYNAKDGFAMKYLTRIATHPVAIITAGLGNSLMTRFRMLGVEDVYTNCHEKLRAMDEFMAKHGLRYEEVLYMGDDIPDLEPMARVGFPVCPADAVQEIVAISRYVSGYNGGRGCVRDVIEQVLRSQGAWAVPPGGGARRPER